MGTIESIRQELIERFIAESTTTSLPGFQAQFAHAAENRAFYLAVLDHVQGRQQIRSVMLDAVQAHFQALAPNSSIPLTLVANYLVGAVLQLLDWWLVNDMPYSIAEMEEIFLKLIRQGIPTALGADAFPQSPSQTV